MIQVSLKDQARLPFIRAVESMDGVSLGESILHSMVRRGAGRQEVINRLRRIADGLHGLANELANPISGDQYFETRRQEILSRLRRFGG